MSERAYRMTARAASTAATRLDILRAVIAEAQERLAIEIRLDAVAARAGVSVQTVLRHYGTRDALIDAAIAQGLADVAEERRVVAGDVDTAFRLLLVHYERWGDFMAHMVAQASADSRIRSFIEAGRRYHRAWVSGVFAAEIAAHPADRRVELIDLLVVATDLSTWRLLRRDLALDRGTTSSRMRALSDALIGGVG